ncbi:MAG: pyridoxal-5-phosphate-dependent protein subunit beta, partial [Spirochaetes bacterium]|nr:pyridoxal-5-phosphate-dependent protein subunit beta [Spirochaetota bacterium]
DLGHYDRKRIHNLKYYTWVEQQGRDVDELNDQWHKREYWNSIHRLAPEIDELIEEFNGLVQKG